MTDGKKIIENHTKTTREIVRRIEALENEKALLQADITEEFENAKIQGYHIPALKLVLKRRRMGKTKRDELDIRTGQYEMELGDA